MDAGTIVAVLSALGAGLTLRRVVDHLLSRGKVQIDQAWQIREELRREIERKNKEIKALDKRIGALESERDTVAAERDAVQLRLYTYKLDVYRVLVDGGVDQHLLNAFLAIS
jgi:polyhydroxyalkanoate synthesis regulator phasin